MKVKTAVSILAMCTLAVAPAASAAKSNPEGDKLPPTASAGYFLGYPSPTYQWHGCTKVASQLTLSRPVDGQPRLPKGNRQSAVQFSMQSTAPYASWEVKPGWRICGVQVGAVLDNPDVDTLLLAEVGYTSGPKKGSTAATGKETIQVKIPTKGIGSQGFEKYEGKTFSIRSIQHVSVFVKKKG
ncbi:MAG: hypothetical protein MUE31_03320 [Candidatus Nanopelagicales bacterium]|nr:hypothetical protein [Candidatus Nanopelagicales bacterium]MCU0294888.1 hypothetical protein [Candidatus Nanopelagicales bacterium]